MIKEQKNWGKKKSAQIMFFDAKFPQKTYDIYEKLGGFCLFFFSPNSHKTYIYIYIYIDIDI